MIRSSTLKKRAGVVGEQGKKLGDQVRARALTARLQSSKIPERSAKVVDPLWAKAFAPLATGLGFTGGVYEVKSQPPQPSKDVTRLLDLADQVRSDGGAHDPVAQQRFINALPVLKDQGSLEATVLDRAAKLVGSKEGLTLTSPQSPGFSGAAIFIVRRNDEPVMVAKVTPHDALIDEVSTQKLLRAGGFDNLPDVFDLGKLEKPAGNNVAVELMSFASGQNIARESWWESLQGNSALAETTFRDIGAATARLHAVKTAPQMDVSKVEGMTRGRLSPEAFNAFMQGASLSDAVGQVPTAVSTAQNLGVGGIEWLRRVAAAPGVQGLNILDMPQLEAQHRELARRFIANPGEAAVAHGDFHTGQLALGEQVKMFDFELLAKNLNRDGSPLMSPAYDHASMLVNARYFGTYAGLSPRQMDAIETAYWDGYTKAGGQKPPQDTLDFFKLWRQTWVVSLFQDLGVAKPGGPDPAKVRQSMAQVLAELSAGIAQRSVGTAATPPVNASST